MNQGQNQVLEHKISQCSYHLGNYKDLRSPIPGNRSICVCMCIFFFLYYFTTTNRSTHQAEGWVPHLVFHKTHPWMHAAVMFCHSALSK